MARSEKAERERLRCQLQANGAPFAQIVSEMGLRFRARPRTAWRYALGWEQWKAVRAYRAVNTAARIDDSRISKWESWPHGGARPSLENLAALALTFGHGCTVADLLDDADLEHFSPAERQLVRDTQAGAYASGLSTDATLEWAERVRQGVADPARYADTGLIDALRLQLETAKALDGRYGAASALPSTLGVIGGLRAVAPHVSDGVRGVILTLGAEAAEFAGWLFRDLADSAQASYWYDQAMEYAQLGGDMSMQGFVLLRKSQMAFESRAGHQVVMLSRAALNGPWQLAPHVRAEALLQATRGALMVGQQIDLERALDEARSAAQGGGLMLREASCWIEAGKPEHAAELYETALATTSISVRDMGYYRSRQAVALAQAAEPDLAAQRAGEALSTAARTGSRRTQRVVQETRTALVPWQSRDSVAALNNALSLRPSPTP
ncbi:hypothetical protein [Promicromonospora sp. NPDC050249]|uniref:hypothetical protein n=1 Tax=Promicromonospora sp. NPDC050249 TaxID=3154743 RepID=UPI0033DDE4C5